MMDCLVAGALLVMDCLAVAHFVMDYLAVPQNQDSGLAILYAVCHHACASTGHAGHHLGSPAAIYNYFLLHHWYWDRHNYRGVSHSCSCRIQHSRDFVSSLGLPVWHCILFGKWEMIRKHFEDHSGRTRDILPCRPSAVRREMPRQAVRTTPPPRMPAPTMR